MSDRGLRALLAPFAPFLADPETTEVVVNRPGEIGVERAGSWSWREEPSLTFDRLDAIGVLAAFHSSQDLSPSQPLCAATLPGGERLQVCRPPATPAGMISLTIRKPGERVGRIGDEGFGSMFAGANAGPSRRSLADKKLIELHRARDWPEFFRLAMRERKTIGVCGKTGSGKTTLLKKLLAEIPDTERIVTIEDTAEFGTAGPANRVNLFYGDGRANLTAEDVLKASLRCRPDRIIMQEVRGAEAFGFFRALASGHSGATSWHAEEGHEWDALELMVKQSAAGAAIADEAIRRYLRQYIDCLVYVARDATRFHAPRVWLKAAGEGTNT